MTATTITLSTIESQAYSNIFDILDTRANVADPRDADGKHDRTFVYDVDPFEKNTRSQLSPYIVLTLPLPEYTLKRIDGKTKKVTWKHNVVVRTERRGSANARPDTGRTDMLSICDDINETINSLTVIDSYRNFKMQNFTLTKTRSEAITISDMDYYESEFDLSYDVHMQVSS